MIYKVDFLIIGGGVIGLSLGISLQKKFPKSKVVIIEKEKKIAEHASGRNSGVIHSGIYYPADSLKARFTKTGNEFWTNYCRENGLNIDCCGKVIVAKSESDLKVMDLLYNRAFSNGIDVKLIDNYELKQIEPKSITFSKAIYVPSTASVDPIEICMHLEKSFLFSDGAIFYDEPFLSYNKNNLVRTARKNISAGHIFNCSGLYSDKVAKQFNFSENYSLVPFKGLYAYSKLSNELPRVHIYPVPDLSKPFLGVHYTRTVNGFGKIGPTSMPSFWRENYQGFHRFNPNEFLEVAKNLSKLMIGNKNNFRKLALSELRKQKISHLLEDVSRMIGNVNSLGFSTWGRPGLRAQLINLKTNDLVMDFMIEGDSKSTHILNAISPAFTCAFPFSEYLIEAYLTQRH
jgi:L-2-hydroxyglutarate oxidase LhgO